MVHAQHLCSDPLPMSEAGIIKTRDRFPRELVIALLGFALGAGATFLVWRQQPGHSAQSLRPLEPVALAQIERGVDDSPKPPLRTERAILQPAVAAAPPPQPAPLPPEAPATKTAALKPVAEASTPESESAVPASSSVPLQIEVDNVFDGTGYNGAWHQRTRANAEQQVTYQVARRGDRVSITHSLPLHRAAQAKSVPPAAASAAESLQWQLPRLTLRFENKTAAPIRVASLELLVRRSDADNSALVVIPNASAGALELENIGWGKAKQAELKLGFAPAQQFDSIDPLAGTAVQSVKLDDLDERVRVDLRERVPADLRASAATAFGTLSYSTEAGERRSLPFKTLVRFDRNAAQRRWRPLFFHHVLLRAGQVGSTVLPMALRLAPGKTLESKLRVASERSARHEIMMTLKDVDGVPIASQLLQLDIFVPRFDAGGVVRTPSALRVASQ